jgi:hypothetical protein
MKSAPPGWQPHQIVTRIDGYIAGHGNRIPAAIAEMIARAMPQPGSRVGNIRTRMACRQRMLFAQMKVLSRD